MLRHIRSFQLLTANQIWCLILPHHWCIDDTNLHVGQRIARRGPSHQAVLPTLPCLKFNLPPFDVGRAGLHRVLGRTINPDVSLLDVLLGNTLNFFIIKKHNFKSWSCESWQTYVGHWKVIQTAHFLLGFEKLSSAAKRPPTLSFEDKTIYSSFWSIKIQFKNHKFCSMSLAFRYCNTYWVIQNIGKSHISYKLRFENDLKINFDYPTDNNPYLILYGYPSVCIRYSLHVNETLVI